MDYDFVVKFTKEVARKQDPYNHHGVEVATLVEQLSWRTGVHRDNIEYVRWAAQLHDIGKFFAPLSLLHMPRVLSETEMGIIQLHTVNGGELCKVMNFHSIIHECVIGHHENWDGTGYPLHVGGYEIPVIARMTRIADVFESMTASRAYRAAYPRDYVLSYLQENKGTLFDPYLVEVFLTMIEENKARKEQYDRKE